MKANKAWTKRGAPADMSVTLNVFKFPDGSRGIRLYNSDRSTFELRLDSDEAKRLIEHLK